jgi:hypothetical protein
VICVGRELAVDLECRDLADRLQHLGIGRLETELARALADEFRAHCLLEHLLLHRAQHLVGHAGFAEGGLHTRQLLLVVLPHVLDRDFAAVDLDALGARKTADIAAEVDAPEHEDDAERDQDRDREDALQLVVDGLQHGPAEAAKNGALG